MLATNQQNTAGDGKGNTAQNDLAQWKVRRGQIKSQLTKFQTFLCEDKSNDKTQLRLRKEKIEMLWEEFDNVQSQIETKDASEEQLANRDTFTEMYFDLMSKAEDRLITKCNTTNELEENITTGSSSKITHRSNYIKLKPLEIPIFNGAFEDWSAFKDIFKSLVHENEELTKVEKFHHLKMSLSDEALKIIKNLETSEINYTAAWKIITDRYDNKRLLIQSHTKSIYELPHIRDESAEKLRHFTNTLNQHRQALQALDHDPDQWGALLLHVITSKLDANTVRQWETLNAKKELPTIKEIINYLHDRCQVLEAVESSKGKSEKIKTFPRKVHSYASGSGTSMNMKCYMCQEPHPIYKCPEFLKMNVDRRIKKVGELKICKNCFRANHTLEQCKARKCYQCNKSHNTLLHRNNNKNETKTQTSDRDNKPAVITEGHDIDESTENTTINAMSSALEYTERANSETQVLLATAIIKVMGNDRTWYTCRALLDSGSQSNFITEETMRKLRLPRKRVNLPITGVTESKHNAEYELTIVLRSCVNSFSISRQALVLPKITGCLPTTTNSSIQLSIPDNITLADPYFYKRGKIDMLIGADTYWEIMCNNIFKISPTGVYVQETKLGWIVAGGTAAQGAKIALNSCMLTCTERENKLSEQIEKFWKTEECLIKENWSIEEKLCDEHFVKNTIRDKKGKFIVKLPLKDNAIYLGKSYDIALRRFLALERRLSKCTEIYDQYRDFMQVYFELGHMEEVNDCGIINDGHDYVYIPHSYVINAGSRTTKLRVVFDASSKTDTGISLNDVLMKGPVIQEELIKIIARFRTHKFAFSGDITKMYRQIWIDRSHRNYQRILWRPNENEEIKIYRLCTVTYGTVSASYQAIKCLSALSEETDNEMVSNIIKYDFCVDDCLTGGFTMQETILLRNNLIATLSKGGFAMAKWTANHPELIKNIPNTDSSAFTLMDLGEDAVKTVGLFWETQTDNLLYKIKLTESEACTKREILSHIASLFDPMGLVGPVIVVAKIIMQSLWLEKVGWDERLSKEIYEKWRKFWHELKDICAIKIPRWLKTGGCKRIEIHGFSDASSYAYGACLYLRSETVNGEVDARLICAKSRVAPLKTTSIPRLELCAAVLLTRLAKSIITTLRIHITQQYWWSDSQVVLAWIAAESSRWKTYVANRVSEIHETTQKHEWHYVQSIDNPADVLSRGCTPTELKNNNLWWNGPSWLRNPHVKDEKLSSDTDKYTSSDVLVEEKVKSVVTTVILGTSEMSIFNRYSSWKKLVHVVAYILRFCNNALAKRRKQIVNKGLLCITEIQLATIILIKVVQRYVFATELRNLNDAKTGDPIRGHLRTLNPFVDNHGVLRVGGRLLNASNITYEQKHQIILPYIEPFSSLFFRHEHERLLHAGPQAMLATIQLQYWPIKGRNTAKKVVHNCIKCFKIKPTILKPIMGNLPKYRVDQPSRCFEACGVDYAGPVSIKSSHRRNAAISKAYICIFICLATKAVHIELVYDLTTGGFIAALKRFISRRGICLHMYSDNATNFVGANKKLSELTAMWNSKEHKEKVQSFFNELSITWHFIPPRAPHFGGLWEAAVKSVKHHLNRTVAATRLTYDEMYTVLVQIEACLNSRPLVPLSNDPNDLAILTPAHFLIGSSLVALPQPDQTHKKENCLSRWERVQKITQSIWKKWSMEYLNQLQIRAKWHRSDKAEIRLGTMVLLKETGVPPLHWLMGRVVSVHPGRDGVTRVVEVNTRGGIKKRAIRLVCPLPGQNQNESEKKKNK